MQSQRTFGCCMNQRYLCICGLSPGSQKHYQLYDDTTLRYFVICLHRDVRYAYRLQNPPKYKLSGLEA